MNVAVAIPQSIVLPNRKFVTTVLSVTLLTFVLLYMYFLTMSVVHVVMRKEAVQASQTLESEIAALETEFMLAQHVVSTAIVANQQFTETSEKIFVSRGQVPTVAFSQE